MSSYPGPYTNSSRAPAPKPVGITEFEILKASHKFLRNEDEKPGSWDEKLAEKYYSNLYREFAVCDLKHYKSGNFALRWRTEEEVLSGAGETTCGNTRCEHHFAPRFRDDDTPVVPLTTLELPFAYMEHGETKSALVKVVLCSTCVKKLMYKRTKEKSQATSATPRENDIGAEGSGSNDRDAQKDVDPEDAQRAKKKRVIEKWKDAESERKRHQSKKRSRDESKSRSRSRERKKEHRLSRKRSKSPHLIAERSKAPQ
ncbi:hypothetical protein D9619_003710 [Psilocybe cf. subviscida]|uniref:Protein FRA10AC1 n=1 Tax=Psilocybe cf. subviscida TaxID=2480587 RepID=A0A8H5AXV3_9AGAR|nr:hypothetical protein D9619_003710 [Psilocybe cf. subviscida]